MLFISVILGLLKMFMVKILIGQTRYVMPQLFF